MYEKKCRYCQHYTIKPTKNGEKMACRKHQLMPCEQYRDFTREPGSDDDINDGGGSDE